MVSTSLLPGKQLARDAACRVGCLVVGLIMLLPVLGWGQVSAPATDYYAALRKQNLSGLWRGEKLAHPVEQKSFPFPEPVGFIGAEYQRFYLHYTNVQRDVVNPYLYHVAGKTRVKNNICSFTGTITVLKSRRYAAKDRTYPEFAEGEVTCRVELAEDRRQSGSGTLMGTLTSYWFLDANEKLYYNTLAYTADRFFNNQCVATWTSYATGQRKPCHWGDSGVPQSGDLFIGEGELELNPKYGPRGWQTYLQDEQGERGTLQTCQAQAEERRQWWR